MMVPHKLYENTLLSIKYFHLQIFTFLSNFTDTISIVEFHYDANETSKSSKHNKRNKKYWHDVVFTVAFTIIPIN